MSIEVTPTYENVLRVWWAYSWRWVAVGAVAFAVMFGLLFLCHLAKLDTEIITKAEPAISFAISVLASQWVIRRLLTKGFGRFRLAMVEK
jgi:hypothetical protein